jgi:predicted hotdog family 3-hydroxylacyl-ACP dehydratase
MMLGQDAIRRLIPHQGAMCLLDTVEYWDDQRVVCRTRQHLSPANPLLASGRLSSIDGVEFAAQAMAVHGGLIASAQAPPDMGLLVSLRDCVLHSARLDDIGLPLDIEVRRIMGNSEVSIYDFVVRADALALIEGRASVLLRRQRGSAR